ncbi:MAG TPA: KpsF/GutQ family sugar-phosphate isomerase [Verrucomicrobia bacterium]|nr:KpsF/GutQ family sugar-phosphate isomerase [Verrucomicrobiota bacterium]
MSKPIPPDSQTTPTEGSALRLQRGRSIILQEAEALAHLADRLDERFAEAIGRILATTGRVVVTGMGKAGIIGKKIAASLASTGTPAFFLHPAEAVHGDLGMAARGDVVLALSNSGRSEELQRILPVLHTLGCPIILITGDAGSPCGLMSDLILDLGPIREACPMGLAPSSSTAAMLAMGDALALTLIQERNFREENYALLHPAGSLGRKLMRVSQVMRTGRHCPAVSVEATVAEALSMITQTPGRAGAISVVDAANALVGFFTDGDLRRLVCSAGALNATQCMMRDVMTPHPKATHPDQFAIDACELMRRHKIDELPVTDPAKGTLLGVLDIQDLLTAGFDAAYDQAE